VPPARCRIALPTPLQAVTPNEVQWVTAVANVENLDHEEVINNEGARK
jgi:hypothetical protein